MYGARPIESYFTGDDIGIGNWLRWIRFGSNEGWFSLAEAAERYGIDVQVDGDRLLLVPEEHVLLVLETEEVRS